MKCWLEYKLHHSSLISSVQIELWVSIKSAECIVPTLHKHLAPSPIMRHFEDLHNDLSSIPLPGNTIRLLSPSTHICLEMPADCTSALNVELIKMAASFTAALKVFLFIYFGGI